MGSDVVRNEGTNGMNPPKLRQSDSVAVAPPRTGSLGIRNARSGFDYLIVGAGFAGSVLAERLASGSGQRVLLIDRRPHIGGNAYDHYNHDGVLIHRYGPTSSTRIPLRSSSTCRGSHAGALTSIACWPMSTTSSCR